MRRQQKLDTVAELKDTFAGVPSLVLADFRGVTVSEVNNLRSEIRKNNCTYRVIKNTLAKRAIAGTSMEGLSEYFNGPTAVAYSADDPIAPAKILDKFSKDNKKFEVKAGFLDGEVLDPKGIESLAKMKGKDELRADLLMLFMTPATDMVRLLNAVPQNFALLLAARERALNES